MIASNEGITVEELGTAELVDFLRTSRERLYREIAALDVQLAKVRQSEPLVGPLAPQAREGMAARLAEWVADGYEPVRPFARRGQSNLF